MREKRSVNTVLVGRPEGMRVLGRPRCRWGYLKRTRSVWSGIHLAEDRDQWQAVVKLCESSGIIKFLEFLVWLSSC